MHKHVYTSLIIGTGFSGIGMAIKLKEAGLHDFLILEKASDIGGTWRENTYPGAECDIPSALYSYSFEPYPHWEYKWSHQPQILDYIKYCADKYEVNPHVHLNKEVASAKWHAADGLWEVNCKSGATYHTKTLITAIGQLHHPSWPPFDGIDSYQGPNWHSAQWDHNVDLSGKRVGVIGNAASAVQFIPQIAKTAGEIIVFQRSANWMLPKQDRLYREWEKKLVSRFPNLLKLYRTKIFTLAGALFLMMKTGNKALRTIYQGLSKKYIKKHIKDPKLIAKLTPTYPLGAKRLLFSDDYYEALSKPHVHLVTEPIDHINTSGIKTTDGEQQDVDVLIYATGFKTNPFLLGLDIQGTDQIRIIDAWKDGPINFKGITTSGFPNMFMMYGPNTNLGHNSIILMSESQAKYITKCVSKIENEKWKSMDIKVSIMQSYHDTIQRRLQKMIWAEIDQSWYKSASGNLPNNWPGRTMEYARITKDVDFSNYNIQKSKV